MERIAEFLIVPAGPGDAAALAEVHVRSWRETYPGLLPDHRLRRLSVPTHAIRFRRQLSLARAGDVVLVAEGPDGLAAYCNGAAAVGGGSGGEAEIHTLYVLKFAQGRGLGRRLFTTTARVLRTQGSRSLRVWVLTNNARARAFYAHIGGDPVAERPVGGWGDGLMETAYVWRDIDVFRNA